MEPVPPVTPGQPVPPLTPGPRRRAGRTGTCLTFGIILAAALAACGGSSPAAKLKPRTITVQGTLKVSDPCTAMSDDGYGDISAGIQVKVSGSKGQTLAVAPLGDGIAGPGTCSFPFTVRGVAAGQSVYGITISHRGTVDYTPAELVGAVTMTLG